MTSPLAKLVLKTAAKYKLSSEAQALLITQTALHILCEMLPQLAKDMPEVQMAFKQSTLFLKAKNSAMASELHMHRMSLLSKIQRRVPHVPCKFIIVHGIKK